MHAVLYRIHTIPAAEVWEALTPRVIHSITVGGGGEGTVEENSEEKEGKE